jgi:signal transduction histidine kinase
VAPEGGTPLEDRRATSPFMKDLSTDARKSLTRILGITQILKHKKDPKEQGQLIKQLTTYARRLDHTVADLAEADRLALGDIALQIKRADLEALVHRVVEESGTGGDRDVRVVAEPLALGVDAQRVEQMLSGLLRASADRTSGGKEIVVRLASTEGGALLSVEDQETSSDASMSPVVKRFAEAHGGWAKVESRPDGGSAFRVFLPDGSPVSDDVKVLVDGGQAPDVWDASAEKILVQELHRLAEAEGSDEKVRSGRSRRAGRKG